MLVMPGMDDIKDPVAELKAATLADAQKNYYEEVDKEIFNKTRMDQVLPNSLEDRIRLAKQSAKKYKELDNYGIT